MDKFKKVIIISLIMVLILIIIITCFLIKNNDSNDELTTEEIGDKGEIIDYSTMKTEPLKDNMKYYTVKSCISEYLGLINLENSTYYGYDDNNNYTKIVSDEKIKERIYNVLSTEYIKSNNITKENVLKYVDELKEIVNFIPTKVNVLIQEDIEKYVVYGFITKLDNKYIEDIYIIVNLDLNNSTFSIEPINKEYNDINQIKITNNNEEISKNNNNIYVNAIINNETQCKEYIDRYKKLCLAKPEIAYENLDKQYKTKRFGSFEKFKEYIEENRDIITGIQCLKYYVEDYGLNTKYVIRDQYDKQYIFNVNSIMDFSMILDTYTIDSPEFTEKYNTAKPQIKVGMNIERVVEALNSKDYEYIYNKLDNTFKNNNYKNLNIFKKYIKDNLYKNNDVQYTTYKEQGEEYIYILKVKEKNNEKSKEKELTIIMKLLEGTDFVMSFNIK